MKVSFLWSAPSGYLAASLRELATVQGWDVQLVTSPAEIASSRLYTALDQCTDWHRIDPARLRDAAALKALVTGFRPDAVVFSGWHNPAFRALARDPALERAGRLMTMDTPWQGTLRQRLGRYLRGPYLRRMHLVVTAGERARQLALALGVPEHRVRLPFLGHDGAGFAAARKLTGPRPPGFLYVGRYAPEKDLATLAAAYRAYRVAVPDPWPLHLCGRGGADGGLPGTPGVTDHGFVAPEKLPEVMREVGAFVLPSRFEPYGMALVEACAAGLPVIASTAVGASVELMREGVTGYAFPAGEPRALTECLLRMHRLEAAERAAMGAAAAAHAEPFAERHWARRFDRWLREAAAEAEAKGETRPA